MRNKNPKYKKIKEQDYYELIDKEFVDLTITGIACFYPRRINKIACVCVCVCGNMILVTLTTLRSGNTSSCGCTRNSKIGKKVTTHGQSDSPLFSKWAAARARCNRPSHSSYKNYGGRGITMHSYFDNFANYELYLRALYPNLDELFQKGYQIDRIDNDGNYEPGNLRLVTPKENNNNRRSCHFIEIWGERLTINQATSKYAVVNERIVSNRLRRGYSELEALLLPKLPPIGGHKNYQEWRKHRFPNDIEL